MAATPSVTPMGMTAWDRHCEMMAQYAAAKKKGRVGSGFTSDMDVLRKEYKFIENDTYRSEWGRKLVVAYCERLYKEYALVDLSRYKLGQVGMRWRVETEVAKGKGHFTCGGLPTCATPTDGLTTLEVPFAYKEAGERKDALVKVRLCRLCRYKLEYKRNEEKRERGQLEANDPPEAPKGLAEGPVEGGAQKRRRIEKEKDDACGLSKVEVDAEVKAKAASVCKGGSPEIRRRAESVIEPAAASAAVDPAVPCEPLTAEQLEIQAEVDQMFAELYP